MISIDQMLGACTIWPLVQAAKVTCTCVYVLYLYLVIQFLARCATCHLDYFACPGHYGHIELPAPVYHPLFMNHMYTLLRGVCLFCHRFKMRRSMVRHFIVPSS